MKAQQNYRIGPPHGNCSNVDPYDQSEAQSQGHPYRLISCQKKCLQKGIVQVSEGVRDPYRGRPPMEASPLQPEADPLEADPLLLQCIYFCKRLIITLPFS